MTGWRDQAACAPADVDPELFHPLSANDQTRIAWARAVCASCPVRQPCLDDAVRTGDDFGIRGGLLPAERREHVRAAARARRADRAAARWIPGTAWIQDAGLDALDGADGQGFLAAGVRTEVKRALIRAGLAVEGQPTSAARGRSTMRLTPAGRALRENRRAAQSAVDAPRGSESQDAVRPRTASHAQLAARSGGAR